MADGRDHASDGRSTPRRYGACEIGGHARAAPTRRRYEATTEAQEFRRAIVQGKSCNDRVSAASIGRRFPCRYAPARAAYSLQPQRARHRQGSPWTRTTGRRRAPVAKEEARERMLAGKTPSGKLPEGQKGEARDKVAAHVGWSASSLVERRGPARCIKLVSPASESAGRPSHSLSAPVAQCRSLPGLWSTSAFS